MYVCADCGCVHGDEHGTAMYLLLAGCPQEQPTHRGRSADQAVGDEPRDRSTGQ